MRLATCIALAMAAGSTSAWAAGEADGGETKILIVDIDDVGFDLLRESTTPNLDWLELNGRFFTSFATAPICAPTRAMLQTGAYPSHPEILFGANVTAFGQGVLRMGSLESLGQIVSASGRTTAKVGKWHLSRETNLDHVHVLGWQQYAGVISNVKLDLSYSEYAKVINRELTRVNGRYITTDEADDGIRCVRAGIDLVSVSFHAPHTPFHVPPAHLHSVSDLSSDRALARAMLEACDAELGRLVAHAIEAGYTILVFSDNGTSAAIGGEKGQVTEGGVINPLWAYGPGVVAGRDPSRIGVQDIYATVADLFDIPAGGATRGPHSRSFARALAGVPAYRRWNYAERFRPVGVDPRTNSITWRRALRGERYKLLFDAWPLGERLVDLEADPDELVNLLDQPSPPAEALAAYQLFQSVLARL